MNTEPETDEKPRELVREYKERRAVENALGLAPRLVFEKIRLEGEEELERPIGALWFSGIAAGILISFSVLAEAILRSHLPASSWGYIIENAGYSLGFLLVIIGRTQLFTENTITTVVPVVLNPSFRAVFRTAKLWGIVLLANIVGAFLVATFYAYAPVLDTEVFEAMRDLSHHATGMPPLEGLMRGVPAGVLIAALVWMIPSAPNSEIALIIIFTWLIALGDFTHIVAGTVEMAFLVVLGDLALLPAITHFFLPVFAGNVLGGTVIFTMLTYAQIQFEIEEDD